MSVWLLRRKFKNNKHVVMYIWNENIKNKINYI